MKSKKNIDIGRIRRTHRGFRLDIWLKRGATSKEDMDTYGYKVITPTGVLFEGGSYRPAYSAYGDRDRIMDGLLWILCAMPDGSNQDRFENYTQEQWQWANSLECREIRDHLKEAEKTV